MKKLTFLILIITIILSLNSCKEARRFNRGKRGKKPKKEVYNVVTKKNENITLHGYVNATGTIIPSIDSDLVSNIKGNIISILKKEGDEVLTNEIVYKIKNDEVINNLKQAEIKLTIAKNNYEKAIEKARNEEIEIYKSRLKLAQITKNDLFKKHKNAKQLLKEKLTSQDDYDQIMNSYNKSVEDLKIAKANFEILKNGKTETDINSYRIRIKEAELALDKAKIQYDYLNVRSLIRGIFTQRNSNIGNFVSTNSKIGKVAYLKTLKIETYISENDISKVKIGQKAIITPSYSNKPVYGIVNHISPIIDESTRSVKVRILIDNNDLKIKSGTFCKIQIIVETKQNVVTVSKSSLLLNEDKKNLFILNGEKVKKYLVKTGLENSTNIEILNPELIKHNFTYVFEGQYSLKDGSKINILNNSKKSPEIKTNINEKRMNNKDRRRRFGNMSDKEKQKRKERFKNMTEEERKKFRENRRKRRMENN